MHHQPALFTTPVLLPPNTPGGFLYRENFLSPHEEANLLTLFQTLPLRHDEQTGYQAKRRYIGYGRGGTPIPEYLQSVRNRAAAFAGIAPSTLTSALVQEYTPGAAIGWHRDKPTHGHVLGVSLGSACQFRLRRQRGQNWQRFTVTAEARSIYCMRGESRTHWQHSIPPVEALRYSITFRDF